MVILDWLEERQTMKAMYRYVTIMLGAQYVMITGIVIPPM